MKLSMYDVKFGDCFTIQYDKICEGNTLLIDFGSKWSTSSMKDQFYEIIGDINNDIRNDKIDILLTHFHEDHVKGLVQMYKDLKKSKCPNYFQIHNIYIPNVFKEEIVKVLLTEDLLKRCILRSNIQVTLFDVVSLLCFGVNRVIALERGNRFGNNCEVLWPKNEKIESSIEQKSSELWSMIETCFDTHSYENGSKYEVLYEFKDFINENAIVICKLIEDKINNNFDINDSQELSRLEELNERFKKITDKAAVQLAQNNRVGRNLAQKRYVEYYSAKELGNEVSIVFQTTNDNKNYLFTGDVDKESLNYIKNNSDRIIKLFDKFFAIKIPHHGTKGYYFDFSSLEPKHLFISNAHRGGRIKVRPYNDSWCISKKYVKLTSNEITTHCTNCSNCEANFSLGECQCTTKKVIYGDLTKCLNRIKDVLP